MGFWPCHASNNVIPGTVLVYAVQDEDGRGYGLALELRWHSHRLEHGPCHAHDGLAPPLHRVVLLWYVWRGEMSLHPEVDEVSSKVAGVEFPAVIREERAQLPPGFSLYKRPEMLDRLGRLVLAAQQKQPHVSAMVVHQQEKEVPFVAGCRRRDGTAQVTVHKLQRLHGVIAHLLRER